MSLINDILKKQKLTISAENGGGEQSNCRKGMCKKCTMQCQMDIVPCQHTTYARSEYDFLHKCTCVTCAFRV